MKRTKKSSQKKLPRARPGSLARFSDRPLPAFLDARCLMIASPSAGPLRAKAGKMMPACAAAGVSGMLPEALALCVIAATGPLPRFYLLCRAEAKSAKKLSG